MRINELKNTLHKNQSVYCDFRTAQTILMWCRVIDCGITCVFLFQFRKVPLILIKLPIRNMDIP